MTTAPVAAEHLLGISRHAYYLGLHQLGRDACERGARMELLPEMAAALMRNRVWYTRTFHEVFPRAADYLAIDVVPHRPHWVPLNPSVAFNGSTMIAVVRQTNYRVDGWDYRMLEDGPDGAPPSWSPTAPLHNAASIVAFTLGVGAIQYDLPDPPYRRSDHPIHGPEDYRILPLGDGSYQLSGTVLDAADAGPPLARIGVCRYVPGSSEPLTPMVVPPEPFDGRNEKNWMPLEGCPGRFIYAAWENGHAATVELDGDRWVVRAHAKAPPIARDLRGGSQAIRCRGLWLAVVHECVNLDSGRVYEHRFVAWDDELKMVGITDPFRFMREPGIEFAAGLAICGHDPDWLVVSYGMRDREARASIVPIASVFDALRSPEHYSVGAADQQE